MTSLLEKALEKVEALPQGEQDAIAAQILDSLADEEGWLQRFAAKRNRLREMAREALDEDERGESRPLEPTVAARCSRWRRRRRQAALGPKQCSTVSRAAGDGGNPYASVAIGAGGVLYGTTNQGGSLGQGTVFALKP